MTERYCEGERFADLSFTEEAFKDCDFTDCVFVDCSFTLSLIHISVEIAGNAMLWASCSLARFSELR